MSRTWFSSRRAPCGGTFRPHLDALEDRFAPTSLAGSLAPPVSEPTSALVSAPSGQEALSAVASFRGSADALITAVVPIPGTTDLHLTATATGEATHLGRFTRQETVILHADGSFDATLVFIAADGAELYATARGSFTSPTTASGTYTFTGGTGRFEGASGSATFAAVASDATHFAITFEGTIQL